MRTRFVLAMVARELRAAGRRFGLYGSCMAIGIAVVVSLHSLREAVNDSVDLRSRELLGADLRLESRDQPSVPLAEALAALEERAEAPTTHVTRLGSMALAEKTGRSRLVDLLAIDGTYPLYGEVWTDPPHRWREFEAGQQKVFVDSSLLLQLDVEVGDTIRLGGEPFEIAAAVRKAPGSFGLQAEVAPRVFVRAQDLDRTGLVQAGSMVAYLRYLKLPREIVDPWVEEQKVLLEDSRMRVQTVKGYQEDLSETFSALTRYLGLVGLAALVLGSIGVAAGVRVFIREKLDTVAMLRSIGAAPREVVAIYSTLGVALGLVAGTMGIVLCLPILGVLPGLFGDLLPVEVQLGLGFPAIVTGLGLSLWATLLCAVGPILDLAAVPPLRALRRDFTSGSEDRARMGQRLAITATAVSLLVASIWQANDLRVGAGFAFGLIVTVGLLGAAARGLIGVLRRHPPARAAYWLRQGVANLFRPRNHTLPTTIAIGFALFAVATVHVVQRNVLTQLAVDSRPDRPNFVLFDVQRDQVEGVEAMLDRHQAAIIDQAPLISARVSAVSGKRRGDWLADDSLAKEQRWALQREYRLTYHHALRDSEELVAGEWWPEDLTVAPGERAPVSLERDLAGSLGVAVGDEITFQVQGVDIAARVASLRQVDWGRMATNFFVVFPPVVLEVAPQSRVLLAYLESEAARAALQRDLVGAFPNVSALDATLILRSLDAMLEQIGIAVRILSLFTLATGLAILVAASMAARAERVREGLLLRILGAPRRTLRRIVAAEAVALAALASGVGGALSLIASAIVVRFVFELSFEPPLLDLAALIGATFLLTALAGVMGSGRASAQSPQAALRASAG